MTEDETFHRVDWYAEELTARAFTRCRFLEVDLTEASTRGVVFTDCTFGNVRFNASKHTDSALAGCTFERCNLFDAEFVGCKVVGSGFKECSLRPLRVTGGDWSFVNLPGADLRGSDLTALGPLHAGLDGAIIDAAQAVVLAGALGLRVR